MLPNSLYLGCPEHLRPGPRAHLRSRVGLYFTYLVALYEGRGRS
jgi:hypothetical protein